MAADRHPPKRLVRCFRLVGKEGAERVRELLGILDELPDYRNGPYADIRKWVVGEIEQTRVRSRVVHRDSIAIRREGAARVALVATTSRLQPRSWPRFGTR